MGPTLQLRIGYSSGVEQQHKDELADAVKRLISEYGTDPVKGNFSKNITVIDETYSQLQRQVYASALVDQVRIAVLGPKATSKDKVDFAKFKSNKVSGVQCVYLIIEYISIDENTCRVVAHTHGAAVDIMRYVLGKGVG